MSKQEILNELEKILNDAIDCDGTATQRGIINLWKKLMEDIYSCKTNK